MSSADLNADYPVKCYSGTTRMQSELSAAFKLVAPKDNWKNPIDTTVSKDADRVLLSDAVVHFTGSVPTFTITGGPTVGIKADGYYIAVGA